jgi:hypothetical protein
VREINLRLDLVFTAQSGRFMRSGGSGGVAFEMDADSLRFVQLERTGMRLLLCDAHFRQDVKNGFALDFQLSGQIVDSNLAHPPSVFSAAR